MINANEYGFLPENNPYKNSEALQKAVDKGGVIQITVPGIYEISEQIEIGDNTKLVFGEGVILQREASVSGVNGNVFINKGALKGEYNRNIEIIGLHLECNGIESNDFGVNSRIAGLRAQVAMIYVENLIIDSFECHGLLEKDYAIQISAFKNIILNDLFITGNKDGVHLGWGDGFVISNGKFRTFDDPIALNAFDYATSNTHIGWIENGIIENCVDLDDKSTTGFFCRILGGAWCKWQKGMQVQHSDTVAVNGKTYRALLNPKDGKLYTSHTPPCHEKGIMEYDGINWGVVRDTEESDCGCRNITIRNCRLQKKRKTAIAVSLNYDTYARSFYPGCVCVPQGGITLENIIVENDVDVLFHSNYPTENITLKNIDFKNSKLCFDVVPEAGEIIYPEVEINIENVVLSENTIQTNPKHPIKICVMK
ncbi:MAG: hypothetical protein E7555_10680 [Ruminococcaceae bacterium]|nr:hypothetical protein [Oscillospiraceae bacterium]